MSHTVLVIKGAAARQIVRRTLDEKSYLSTYLLEGKPWHKGRRYYLSGTSVTLLEDQQNQTLLTFKDSQGLASQDIMYNMIDKTITQGGQYRISSGIAADSLLKPFALSL